MGSSPPGPFLNKPLGYSLFPNELFPVPGSWAGTIANLVHYKRHEKGGHFAVSRSKFELFSRRSMSLTCLTRPWRGRRNFLRMSRSGFRRPGRLAEVLSFEPPSMNRGNDKDDAKHSTDSNDMKREKDSQETQTDCKYTSMATHDSRLGNRACISPLYILDINLPPTPTPHNRTSPLALPIQRQARRFPLALILTKTMINLTPTIHHLNLPIVNLIRPRNRLTQFPLHCPDLSSSSPRNEDLRLYPSSFQPPLLSI